MTRLISIGRTRQVTNIDNITKTFIGASDFIDYVRLVSIENGDLVMINTADEADKYIMEFCPDLLLNN